MIPRPRVGSNSLLQAALLLPIATVVPLNAQIAEREKLSDDPTKIVKKIGFRYSDFATIFGLIAFGPLTKVNVSFSEDERWSIGGSYLFDFGIVNVATSQKALSIDLEQTKYSMGIQPFGWLLFLAVGANRTEGSLANFDFDFEEALQFETSSKGGYHGLLALEPLIDKWVIKSGVVLSAGSNDYSEYSVGGGLTYNVSTAHSISVFGSYSDNSFGQRDLLGISYKREI